MTHRAVLVGFVLIFYSFPAAGSEMPLGAAVRQHWPWGVVIGILLAALGACAVVALRLFQRLKTRAEREKQVLSLAAEHAATAARIRNLFEQAADGIFVITPYHRYLDANQVGLEMLGYSREELLGLHVADVLVEGERSRLDVEVPVMMGGKPHLAEWVHLRKDGTTFPAEVSARPLSTNEYLAIVRDLTPRKQVEEQLRQTNESLATVMDSLNALIYVADMETHELLFVNKFGRDIWGDIAGKICWQTLQAGQNGPCAFCTNHRLLDADGAPAGAYTWEFQNTVNGHWYDCRDQAIRWSDGRLVRMEIATDITERKQAEAALAASEAEFRRLSQEFHGLLDAIPDNLTLQDRDLKILWANSGAAKGLGIIPEELIGQRCFALWHGRSEPCTPCPVTESFTTCRPASLISTSPDGRVWDLRTIPLPDSDGVVTRVIELGRDITEHRKLEAQFLQAQKMESVGRLAGGVAHDFNNMLTIVIGYGEQVLSQIKAVDPVACDISEMVKAARRSAGLTRQLLAFSRQQTILPQVIDLNDLLGSSQKMLKRLVGEDIDLRFTPADGLWRLHIDPTQVDQVLANLTVNARDAISGVGIIRIEIANEVLDAAYCSLHPGAVPGDYVMIGFRDSGAGMSHETLRKIFDPFFTTKEEGKGTGLGLSTVYGIVKQNGGFINVDSEPGHGTSFEIYLPRYTGPAAQPRAVQAEAAPGGTETILLVEDEGQILAMCKRLLEKQGYRVLAAKLPEEALALCEEFSGDIHLLVSDVIMPEMNGRELQKKISEVKPGVQVLFMSGYTADIINREGGLAAGTHFIQKPFTNRDFIDKVRQILNQG